MAIACFLSIQKAIALPRKRAIAPTPKKAIALQKTRRGEAFPTTIFDPIDN